MEIKIILFLLKFIHSAESYSQVQFYVDQTIDSVDPSLNCDPSGPCTFTNALNICLFSKTNYTDCIINMPEQTFMMNPTLPLVNVTKVNSGKNITILGGPKSSVACSSKYGCLHFISFSGPVKVDLHINIFNIVVSGFGKKSNLLDGGAISINSFKSVHISGVILSSNIGANGGALSLKNCRTVNIRNTVFSANNASACGGALYMASISSANISLIQGSRNRAATGGFLCLFAANKNLNIARATISGNSATTSGGGVYLNKQSIRVSLSIYCE